MKVSKFIFNGFQENTFVLYDEQNNAVIIDPGCYDRHEEQQLFSFIEENKLKVLAILNTHAHVDHVLGVAAVQKKYNCDFYLHEDDVPGLDRVESYARMYGFEGYIPPNSPTHLLKGGEVLNFGSMTFQVFHTPGHCKGHVVFYNKEEKLVVNGDVLFRGSFGRTDLPGGDFATLKKFIMTILFELPVDTKVLCGHGPETTIGEEKVSNYILEA